MAEYKYIVVDGLIKSGKSRVVDILNSSFKGRVIKDIKENPFSEDFMQNHKDSDNPYALKSQMIYLLNRYSQQTGIKQKGLFQKITVSDYLFFREGVYANLILNDEDLKLYKKMYDILAEKVTVPDLTVYLQLSFPEMVRRIQKYGSAAEKQMPVEYWRDVFEAYNYYFFNYKLTPLLVVNMEKINLENRDVQRHLTEEILNHKSGTVYYAPA